MQFKHLLLFLVVTVGLGQDLIIKADPQVTTTVSGGIPNHVIALFLGAGMLTSAYMEYKQPTRTVENTRGLRILGFGSAYCIGRIYRQTINVKSIYQPSTCASTPKGNVTIDTPGHTFESKHYGACWNLAFGLCAFPIAQYMGFILGNQLREDQSIYQSYGSTPEGKLLAEARFGNVEKVEYWLDQGVEINVRDPFGNTPLTLAAQYGHYQVVDLLLQRGANEELANKDHKTAYILARNEFRKTRKKVYHTIMRLIIEWPRKRQKIYTAMDKEYESINQQEQRTVFPRGLRTIISKYVI